MEFSHCKKYIKLFLKGELSRKEEVDLLQWIKQSPENKAYFYKLQKSFEEEVERVHDQSITMRWQQLLNRIDPGWTHEASRRRTFRAYSRWLLPLAAAFFIGFVIAAFFFGDRKNDGVLMTMQQKVSTPYGARTQFMLPDSSEVWLNAGSELQFPARFAEGRNVTLVGEAYFEVKKGNHPFVVSTGYGMVEVKGTSFNVKAFPGDHFETTLESGEVNVFSGNGQEVLLRPGFQAVLKDGRFQAYKVETELYTSWREGKLIFREEYLPELTHRLERWYNVTIELDNDPRLRNINYTGTIEMETFSEVLNLLSVTAPVDYTWDDKTRIIKIFYSE